MSILVYVDSTNQASTLIAGLYSDKTGHPGSRLASGSLSSPTAGAWDTVTFASAAVKSGTTYWIAVLGKGANLFFRDRPSGPCFSESSSSSSLSSLPSSWTTAQRWTDCPISAYVMGTLASGGTPPSNTTLPLLSGTTTQAQTLSTTNGTWTGSPTGYTYQWQDCNTSGNSCTSLSGATSSNHMLTSGDAGHTMRAVVTASNTSGSTPATSAASAIIAPSPPPPPPANTAAPAITGTTTQGQILSATNGTWTGSPTGYTYQWQDCASSGSSCTGTSGATSSSYMLSASDVGHTMRAVITATNAGGSASATSGATAAVAAAAGGAPVPSFTYSPAAPATGQAVHFDGTASVCSAAPCTYTWADGASSLGSGQTLDFTFHVAATKFVMLTVTDASARSASVEHDVVVTSATTPAPSDTALPTVTGTPTQSQVLSTSDGTWTGSPAGYTYQWRQCDTSGATCTNVGGATNSYQLTANDVGHTMRAVVTATNSGGSTAATSGQTPLIAAGAATAPGTPTGVTAVGGDTAATVNWTAPADGGQPITSYTVTPYIGASPQASTTVSGSPPVTTVKVTGLTNGTVYTAKVTATNSVGISAASSASNSVTPASGGSGYVCTQHVTTSTFVSALSSAGAGAVLCLAPGNYGTFAGAAKSSMVVVTSDQSAGATAPVLRLGTCQSCSSSGDVSSNVVFTGGLNLTGASFITLDSVTIAGGTVTSPTHDIQVLRSNFTDALDFEGLQNANVLLDRDGFDWDSVYTGYANGKISFHYSSAGLSGVTVSNSLLSMGNLDGIHTGTAFNAINNSFAYICDDNTNHTDQIQFEGAIGGTISGNYFYAPSDGSCGSTGQTQGITSYDGGTQGVVIANNVINIPRSYCIEFYLDNSSIISHNTCLVAPSGCGGLSCGNIDIDTKVAGEGSGTRVYDNVVHSIAFGNGATGSEDHNLCAVGCGGAGDITGMPTEMGGATPSNWSGYWLAPGSLGITGADDGGRIGIRAGGPPGG